MADIFRIELLPACHGDCMLLEYGDAARPRRVLIDGGPIGAWNALSRRLGELPDDQRRLELLVISHIDGDHIEGCLKLLNHPEIASFEDIWFNGWPHIAQVLKDPSPELAAADSKRSARQGTEIATRIDGRVWNAAFGGQPVFMPTAGPLPVRELPGGLRLTVLSPDLDRLKKLRSAWQKALAGAAIDPDDVAALGRSLDGRAAFRAARKGERPRPEAMLSSAALALGPIDAAVANGSSIALLAEYGGRSVALLADAHMPPVVAALDRLAEASGMPRLRLDAVKMAHHGSSGNLSEAFVRKVDCRNWLVSTDGSIFGHPDEEALHTVVRNVPGARLIFNYRSDRTAGWDTAAMREAHGHAAFYPAAASRGIALDLVTGIPA